MARIWHAKQSEYFTQFLYKFLTEKVINFRFEILIWYIEFKNSSWAEYLFRGLTKFGKLSRFCYCAILGQAKIYSRPTRYYTFRKKQSIQRYLYKYLKEINIRCNIPQLFIWAVNHYCEYFKKVWIINLTNRWRANDKQKNEHFTIFFFSFPTEISIFE